MYPNDGFRELERRECLRLLAQAPVGRIVHTRQALPAVLPVNFALDTDDSVLLRTSSASELVRAIEGSVVAFEVDEVDAATHSGWSVVVTGSATVVRTPPSTLGWPVPARPPGCRRPMRYSSASNPSW